MEAQYLTIFVVSVAGGVEHNMFYSVKEYSSIVQAEEAQRVFNLNVVTSATLSKASWITPK